MEDLSVSLGLSQHSLGILQLLASGICFGFLGLFGKFAFENGLQAGVFLALRFALGAGILGVVVVFSGLESGRVRVSDVRWEVRLKALLLGVLGYAVFASCYFHALKGLTAGLTVLLLYLFPGVVVLIESVMRGRLPSTGVRVALGMALMGLLMMVGPEWRVERISAFVAGVAAAVFYAIYIILSARWLRGIRPVESSFWIQLGAALALAVVYPRSMTEWIEAGLQGGWPLVGAAWVSTVAAISLFLAGLRRVAPSEASILSMTEAIAGVGVGFVWLGERMTTLQVLGAALILSSMVVIVRQRV